MLVANPTAHSGKAADWIRHARALLDDGQRPASVRRDRARRAATIERVREAIDDGGARVVIYMGGDGTFAEVAKGIFASQHAARRRDGHAADRHRERSGQVVRTRPPAPAALERNVAVIAAGETVGCDVGTARDRARRQGDPSRSVLRFVLDRPRRREPRDAQSRSRAGRPHPGPRRDLSRSARLRRRGAAAVRSRATSSTSSSISRR